MATSIFESFLSVGSGHARPNAAVDSSDIVRGIYLRSLIELAANRFQWTGLPPEVDVRYLELTMVRNGMSYMFYDTEYNKFMAVPASPSGMRNMMDEPVAFTVPGRGPYKTHMMRKGEGVPIWSNYLQTPDIDVIMYYANKLAEMDRTIDINVRQARRTRLLIGNKNQRSTLANVSRQIDQGVAAVGVNASINVNEQITSHDMGADVSKIINMQVSQSREWNKCMGLLGINHANQDKKERLVSDEVAANDEQVTAMKAVALNARRHAAEEINALYDGSRGKARITGYTGEPLNVSVDFMSEDTGIDDLKELTTDPAAEHALDLASNAPSLVQSVGLPQLAAQVAMIMAGEKVAPNETETEADSA